MHIFMSLFNEGYGTIEITCPKCDSENVLISQDEEGHFWISRCYKCGYEKKMINETP